MQTFRIYIEDIGMEFEIEKFTILIILLYDYKTLQYL